MAAKTVTCRCKVVPEAGVTDEQTVAEFRALGLGEIGFFKTKEGRTGVLTTHGLIEPNAEGTVGKYVRYVSRASVLLVNPAEAGGIEIEVSYRAVSDRCREGDDRNYGCAEDRPTLDLYCGSRIVARGSWNDMRDRFVERLGVIFGSMFNEPNGGDAAFFRRVLETRERAPRTAFGSAFGGGRSI